MPTHSTSQVHAHKSYKLDYGHFGTATYDSHAQEWNFLRSNLPQNDVDDREKRDEDVRQKPLSINCIEEARLVDKSLSGYEIHETSGYRSSNVNAFVKYVPQSACGIEAAEFGVNFIEDATTEPDNYDKTASFHHSLAFGYAAVLEDEVTALSNVTVPIAIRIHPFKLSQVLFSNLKRDHICLADETGQQNDFVVPEISDTEYSIWHSRVGCVNSVYSSTSDEQKATLFAASSDKGTTFFQPFWQQNRSTQKFPDELGFVSRKSHLEPNPILYLPNSATGGTPHVHLAFDTATSKQFALIDAEGSWSVWTIGGRRSTSARNLFRGRLLASGSLISVTDINQVLSQRLGHSSFYRILSIRIPNHENHHLIACDRRVIKIFDERGKNQISLNGWFPTDEKHGQILDIQSSIHSNSELFVLTTSHLLWWDISSSENTYVVSEELVNLIAAWNHFRSRDDKLLRMHVIGTTNGTLIFVSSPNHPIISIFSAAQDRHPNFADPVSLEVPKNLASSQIVHVQPCEVAGTTRNRPKLFPDLIRIYFLDSEKSVWSTTFELKLAAGSNVNFSEPLLQELNLPAVQVRQYRSDRLVEEEDSSDFIVEDTLSSDHESRPHESERIDDAATHEKDIVCDMQPTYGAVMEHVAGATSLTKDTLAALLAKTSVEHNPHLQTLSHLIKDRVYLADIELDSRSVEKWLETLQINSEINEDTQNLLGIYQGIIEDWISNLSADVSGRVKISQEKLARRVALELYFAKTKIPSATISAPNDSETLEVSMSQDHLNSEPELPPLPLPSSQTVAARSSQPDPSLSGFGENFEQIDNLSTFQPSLLRKYTRFDQPLSDIPSSISDILAHLPTKITDPAEYSYNTVEASIFEAQSQADFNALDTRARRRAERALRAKQKRKERMDRLKSDVLRESSYVFPSSMPSQSQSFPSDSQRISNANTLYQDASGSTAQASPSSSQLPFRSSQTRQDQGVSNQPSSSQNNIPSVHYPTLTSPALDPRSDQAVRFAVNDSVIGLASTHPPRTQTTSQNQDTDNNVDNIDMDASETGYNLPGFSQSQRSTKSTDKKKTKSKNRRQGF